MGIWSNPLAAMLQRKSAVAAPVAAKAFGTSYGLFLQPTEITPFQADLLYKSVSTLAKVVNQIADQVAGLVPMVKVNGEVVDGHPVTEFLKRPGFNRTRRRLIKELCVQYLVSGTAYPHVMGNPDRFPVAIDVIKTKNVSVFPGPDMWPQSLAYSEGTRSNNFEHDGQPRDPRWIDRNGFSEIVPIYDMDGDRRGVGLSRLNAIRNDVELRYKGISHNAALLDNGARMSGVLSYKEALNKEQRDDVKAQLREYTTGANKGGILVTAGGEADFNQLSQSAKDMDFANLVKVVEDAIITNYNVPVTLYRTDAQTNNNYETAWFMFYDNAVLPTFEIIYAGLSQIFSERMRQEIEITHDALTNPVLAKQASGRARELFSAHLVSRNEARNICGYEPVLGGDTIYGPLGEVPVGEDMFTGIDDAMNADGYQAHRRSRNPDEAGPSPGEEAEQRAEAANKPKPVAAKKRLALIYDRGNTVPRALEVKAWSDVKKAS